MDHAAKSCFFIGHRHADRHIYESLLAAVETHISEYGATDFLVGHYGDFDRMAAQAVAEARHTHPGISLTMLLPYYPEDRAISVPPIFDGTFYPPGMEFCPKRYAIVRANQYAIEHNDYLIAYVTGVGKSRDFLNYAERKGVPICNLGAND